MDELETEAYIASHLTEIVQEAAGVGVRFEFPARPRTIGEVEAMAAAIRAVCRGVVEFNQSLDAQRSEGRDRAETYGALGKRIEETLKEERERRSWNKMAEPSSDPDMPMYVPR